MNTTKLERRIRNNQKKGLGFLRLPIVLSIGVIGVAVAIYFYSSPPTAPILSDIKWKEGDGNEEIVPFSIDVQTEVVHNLKARLRNTRIVPPLQGVNFKYGFNTNQLKKIIDFWINDYNWEQRQKLLNTVPQYRTKISGLYIHFIHSKPNPKIAQTKKVLPLLLLHGWPGSVKEFYGVFLLLTQSKPEYNFVFEIIAPSLPGYGFSEAATKPGLNTAHIGLIMKKLMNRLGFDKFYVQGGDWGSVIGNRMATLFPESIIGYHSNLCMVPQTVWGFVLLVVGSFYPSLMVENEIFQKRIYPLSDLFSYLFEESGYFHLQATKPDTVGVALTDSPAGLAAYILEKFSTWENFNFRNQSNGGLNIDLAKYKNYAIVDLLDNVMIYWITNSITSSMRLYSEEMSHETRSLGMDSIPSNVPTACANYPYDLMYSPEMLVKSKFPILLHFEHMPKGGHFAAFEHPEIFAEDLWIAVNKIENYVA